jgi:hypothetical protein
MSGEDEKSKREYKQELGIAAVTQRKLASSSVFLVLAERNPVLFFQRC